MSDQSVPENDPVLTLIEGQISLHKHLKLLNEAALIAIEHRQGNAAKAHALYAQAMEIGIPVDLRMLGHAVAVLINSAALYESSEPHLHRLFESHVEQLIAGARIAPLRKDAGNIPDFMVEIGGVHMPVEIKDHAADDAALRQIERYISRFSDNGRGFLAAPKLAVTLPDHITFVCLDHATCSQLTTPDTAEVNHDHV